MERGSRTHGLSGFRTHAHLAVARGLSCPTECGVSAPHPELEPTFPALEGRFLTTGPPGTPHGCFRRHLLDISVVAVGIPLTNTALQGREPANQGSSCHAPNPLAAFLPRPHFWWAAFSQLSVQNATKAGSSLGNQDTPLMAGLGSRPLPRSLGGFLRSFLRLHSGLPRQLRW